MSASISCFQAFVARFDCLQSEIAYELLLLRKVLWRQLGQILQPKQLFVRTVPSVLCRVAELADDRGVSDSG